MRGKVAGNRRLYTCSGITPAYAGKRAVDVLICPVYEDHPRLCGEKAGSGTASVPVTGSPPPMRGKATRPKLRDFPHGITPAYAGKSLRTGFHFFFCWDHPRLCGEKSGDASSQRLPSGSPPPMRGKDAFAFLYHACKRITPAYAGKSFFLRGVRLIRQDHPRLCGEKHAFFVIMYSEVGSPPPMRGKVKQIAVQYAQDGDHPRLCGEKVAASQKQACESGSPPPMRGKELYTKDFLVHHRITPAYAGKSSSLKRLRYPWWDHPRLCGEKLKYTRLGIRELGSPPPMRGKVFIAALSFALARITPAYAGKSFWGTAGYKPVWDHPRLCGEKFRIPRITDSKLGSPPPMRGKV